MPNEIHPFPGLRSFEETEDHLFFGRDGQSEAILAAMRRSRLLAIVGASGSGKSSLIRAGLIPYLHGGFLEPAGARWRISVMRPGADPMGALARGIVDQELLARKPSNVDEAQRQVLLTLATLRRSGLGLVDIVRLARLPADDNILLVVDQFEELFRFGAAAGASRDDGAAAFVKLLLEATRQSQVPIYIILTMRSDFIGDCARFRDLPESVTRGLYLVPRLTRTQRREVIEGPIRVAGGSVTPRLITRVLNDIGDDPDQLPILQHAMMRAWDYWRSRPRPQPPLDLQDYEAIGGATEALSIHADEAFASLNSRGQAIARKSFQCLTVKDAENREARRPTQLGTIAAVAEATVEETAGVVEVFRSAGRSFLMPPPAIILSSETAIDISHESLIRGWRRLRDWVEEETESARIYLRLAETAALHSRGMASLWRDPDLSVALTWEELEHPTAAWASRYHEDWHCASEFLSLSRTARDVATETEAAARRSELRRVRTLLAGTFAALLVFAGLASYAYHANRMANDALEDAIRQKRAAETAEKHAIETTHSWEQSAKDANHQRDIAESSLDNTIAIVEHLAAIYNENGKIDEALKELSEYDDMILEYNAQNTNDRRWLPAWAKLRSFTAALLLEKKSSAEAIYIYRGIETKFIGAILRDPSFLPYRVWFLNAVLWEADASRTGEMPQNQIHALSSSYLQIQAFSSNVTGTGELYQKLGEFMEAFANALSTNGQPGEAQLAGKEALSEFGKAADAGDPNGANKLGFFFEAGKWTTRDEKAAVKWYRKAAQSNFLAGETNLGRMLADGRGVEKNEIEAVGWYRNAAEGGEPTAQYYLGMMLETGRGVEKSEPEAVKWYRKAAQSNSLVAETSLGRMLAEGRGVEKNEVEAVHWYRKAAEGGEPAAQNNLGLMLTDGAGVARNDAEAVTWYRKAAQSNYLVAETNLGWMLAEGRGVEKDEIEAVRWYRKAAEGGEPTAQNNLGIMLEAGRGVEKSDSEAVRWYQKAAAAGNLSAEINLARMLATGSGVDRNVGESFRWYLEAANGGKIDAELRVAELYANGIGTTQSDSDAIYWYRKFLSAERNKDAVETAQSHLLVENAEGHLGVLLNRQGKYQEASAALELCLASVATILHDNPSIAPPPWLQQYARILGSNAYNLLLQRDYELALQNADQALSAAPSMIFTQANRAHALMMLGRTNEAETIYRRYLGRKDVIDDKSWEQGNLADFAELRNAGISDPLMDRMELLFTMKPAMIK